MRVVVVGYGTAGSTAAAYAAKENKHDEIIVLEKRSYPVYHPCSIPDKIAGKISEWRSLIDNYFYAPNLKVITNTIVNKIDKRDKKVIAIGEKGNTFSISFDKLIIATGSRPIRPMSIPGINLDGVYTLKDIEDGILVEKDAQKAKNAVVVGGSYIGVETAIALKERGINVTIVELKDRLFPKNLDPDMSSIVLRMIKSYGINVYLNSPLKEIIGEKRVKKVVAGEKEIESDLVVLAIGVKPNTELAANVGIESGKTGGIKVDDTMRTSVDYIYAAGDCAEVKEYITKMPIISFLANSAFQQGRIAGINAVGKESLKYEGALLNSVLSTSLFNLGILGLSSELIGSHIKTISMRIRSYFKPRYYQDSKPIYIKLIADKQSMNLLGAQIIGNVDVTYIMNFLTLAIRNRISIDRLINLEYSYMPALCDIPDPIFKALDALYLRFNKS